MKRLRGKKCPQEPSGSLLKQTIEGNIWRIGVLADCGPRGRREVSEIQRYGEWGKGSELGYRADVTKIGLDISDRYPVGPGNQE